MKDDLVAVTMQDNMKEGVDFEIVSRIYVDENYVPHLRGSKKERIIPTPFPEQTKIVFLIENHEIDMDLAITLGLGIVKELATGNTYLYDIDDDKNDEMLKVGMYYQLTHPDYDDRKLDGIIRTKGGLEYLKMVMFIPSQDVVDRLCQIFDSKKGHANNVLSFKNKKV